MVDRRDITLNTELHAQMRVNLLNWVAEVDEISDKLGALEWKVTKLTQNQYISTYVRWATKRTIVYAFSTLGKCTLIKNYQPRQKTTPHSIYKCCSVTSTTHYHLKMGGSTAYPDYKRAFRRLTNILFRSPHPADESHTRVYSDEAFIAFFSKNRTPKQSLAAANQALSRIPIGTTTVWLTNQLLWHCLTPVANTMWEDLPDLGLCGLDDLASAKVMKVAETAYRRTNRWLNGKCPQSLGLP